MSPESRRQRVGDLRVAVLGAGLMGHSIAGVFSLNGATVSLYDTERSALDSARARVSAQLQRRGLDVAAAQAIRLDDDLDAAVTAADLVIESIPERLELKQQVLRHVGQLLPNAVLATNSSVLRTSDIAALTPNPARVLGAHWFNPPHLVPIVEVVQGEETALEDIDWVMDILRQVGKLPVHVRKDVPGFIGSRLQQALWREAIHLVEAGVCDAETVDLVARNSFGLRLAAMGPLENADFVGLDLALAVHENIFPSLCRDTGPSPLLQQLVASGELGAKTGAGFMEWPAGSREAAAERLDRHLIRSLEDLD